MKIYLLIVIYLALIIREVKHQQGFVIFMVYKQSPCDAISTELDNILQWLS